MTPKALKKNKNKQQQQQQQQQNESQQNTDSLLHRRSLPGSRSIKDVVKDGVPRYVKSDDVKRISQADKDALQNQTAEGKSKKQR